LIVLDTSPVLVSGETQVLSRLVGQILFVVRANSTAQDAVVESVGRLNVKCPIGLVLNRWHPVAFSEREYYGLHYSDVEERAQAPR
jgi:Mrp family chromosome partitioning ATPase